MEHTSVGVMELITSDEERLAEYLKRHYLEKTNENALPVHPQRNIYSKYIKRLADILVSFVMLVLTLPFNIIFGICTFFDVGRPIFYKQTRSGRDGKPFTIVKFRNMNEKKDADGRLLPPSQRVTRFGKFMRKLSLDELLNFWSVFKGDMSIIGPRPLPVTFTDRMCERHKMRNAVRPGLECPRYIPNNPDWSKYQNQFENDVWYVENIGFTTDLKMLVLLFKLTFNFEKREKNAQGGGYFVGYDEDCAATTLNRFKRLHPEKWEEIRGNRQADPSPHVG